MFALALFLLFLPPEKEIQTDSSRVASIGKYSITVRDLMESYEFGPAFVKQHKNPLRSHLEFMIYERLLALDAETMQFDTTKFVKERVAGLEEDLTVDELYKKEILSKSSLTTNEIERGIAKAKVQLRMRWIFAMTKQEAERIHKKLAQGLSFDSLFLEQENPDGKKYETFVLKLERDNPAFAKALSSVKNQEISAPIKGTDGFYIVRLDEVWQNPVTTETEYVRLKDEAIKIVSIIKANRLADAYVSMKMKIARPIIKSDGYNILRAFLADKGLSRDTKLKWDIPSTFMTEAGALPITSSGKFLNKTLVTYNKRTLTVQDYLRWFDIRQFQLKTSSLEAFNASVKQTIWKMVQDRMLSEEAYSQGLDKLDTVRSETLKWNVKLLYLAARAHYTRSIVIPDSVIRVRYNSRKNIYRDDKGKQFSFADAKRIAWEDLYREEEVKILTKRLQQLKQQYPVIVNEILVQQVSTTMQPEPSPINMMMYKPGGTFPRVAYPTIDDAWYYFE